MIISMNDIRVNRLKELALKLVEMYENEAKQCVDIGDDMSWDIITDQCCWLREEIIKIANENKK